MLYIIVGREGHTTDTLRRRMNEEYPEIETSDSTEAECYAEYISHLYAVKATFLKQSPRTATAASLTSLSFSEERIFPAGV